ncbi:uncharacterized protein I303_103840 [Kwoniella dejecticola CBS 10117]|uniref:Transposase subfamily n=1 Tax=Kwoniella dejecticola CBS 10117 TaxID=1296121 RepID=A0A1A6A7V5_9TREE|nr:transposase subfamily [Kwoniella dejecticola CBS 10117]OBR86139.1 transposase subfamily [Kwoniella dejecticola CBS 10117]
MVSLEAKLRIAVFGVGRMGQRHATNVAYSTPRAQLVAVCHIKTEALEWAKANLPEGTKYYSDPAECLADPDVDAVLIASVTSSHPELTLEAIKAGKHVLCEKPISISIEESIPVVKAAAEHPEVKVMIGFSRRYDASYRETKGRIEAGQLGTPYLIKSATNDQYDPSGFFIAYSKLSGAIFMDCGIHDIDIARWLLDVENPKKLSKPKKQVTRVFATGLNAQHPELANDGDCDNGLAVVDFENGTKCTFHLSRTATHGHDCFCEVFGTDGKIIVNGNPTMSRVEIRDSHGVRTESTPNYYDRFREAFVTEVNTFTECVLDDKPVPTTAQSALDAAVIASALTYSFRNEKPIYFDDNGNPILN